MTWRATVWLVLAVLAARIAHLVLFCHSELAGDEAFYWEWSRRLGLCYYEKGPGIAYLIAASTALFGTSEWTVRLPMAVAAAVATLALARLALACTGGDQRVGFLTAVLFTLMPAYQANALISTQDGPFVTFWILGCWAAWHLFDRLEHGRPALVAWLIVGVVIGLGCLFKQSMLLLAPSLLLYAVLRRRHIRWGLRLARDAVLSAIVFMIVISPMLIWNAQHDWPTLAHTLGHVGAPGGDISGQKHRLWYNPLWTLRMVGAQIGFFGPPVLILMVQAVRRDVRARKQNPQRWPAQLLMICCAAPSLVLYTAITFWKKTEVNWPVPAFATLLVLVAELAVVELGRQRQLKQEWLAAPAEQRSRRAPKTRFRVTWDAMVGYGIGGWVFIWLVASTPGIFPAKWVKRFTGSRARAVQLDELRQQTERQTGATPFLAASHYQDAALYAFYLPDHPSVCCASHLMGERNTSYDFWADTDLRDTRLLGRPGVLVGDDIKHWESALSFDTLQAADPALEAFVGRGYRGPARP